MSEKKSYSFGIYFYILLGMGLTDTLPLIRVYMDFKGLDK